MSNAPNERIQTCYVGSPSRDGACYISIMSPGGALLSQSIVAMWRCVLFHVIDGLCNMYVLCNVSVVLPACVMFAVSVNAVNVLMFSPLFVIFAVNLLMFST